MSKRSEGRRGFGFVGQFMIIMAVMTTMFVGLIAIADKGTTHIPFKWEKRLMEVLTEMVELPFKAGTDEVSKAWAKDLQKLIDNLAANMDMDEEIEINVDYSPEQVINAVAIMGGQVIVFDGLINLAQSENALSFVLAHEIAHLKHRDGLRSMTRQTLVTSAILIVFGTSGNVSNVAAVSSQITGFKYSRDIETAADEAAIETLAKYYGHVNGMDQIFGDVMKLAQANQMPPEILSTHPDFAARIKHMEDYAKANGWSMEGDLTPMRFTMNQPDPDSTCTMSEVLCRIENSVDRIRTGQVSLIDPDPMALEDVIDEMATPVE